MVSCALCKICHNLTIELLAFAVDSDGSGEVELPEFIEIMTMTRETADMEEEATPRSQV